MYVFRLIFLAFCQPNLVESYNAAPTDVEVAQMRLTQKIRWQQIK